MNSELSAFLTFADYAIIEMTKFMPVQSESREMEFEKNGIPRNSCEFFK